MAAVINRSVTSLHNELEFLFESEVISKALYDDICNKIPRKLTPGQKLDLPISQNLAIAEVTERVAAVQITPIAAPTPSPASPAASDSVGKVEALYDYAAQDPTDLALFKGDQIEIIEKLNNDWWKGRGPSGAEGIFPANYVKEVSNTPYGAPVLNRSASSASTLPVSSTTTLPTVSSLAVNEKSAYPEEKSAYPSYKQPDYAAPATNYNPPPVAQYNPPPPTQYNPPPPGDYSYQAPPPSGYQQGYQPPPPNGYQQPPQQYYQPPPPQTVVVEQGEAKQGGGGHLKSIGSKFGNAAIFGAGATLGGDLINSIF